MNYRLHYDRLIERAVARGRPDGYSERHHIVPKCMGGGDAKDNLVRLTAEEHYVAHQLLVKMHPEHLGLIFGAHRMTHGGSNHNRANNKYHAWLRRRRAEAASARRTGKKLSPEWRASISAAKAGKGIGRKHDQETCAKISAAMTGKQHSLGYKHSPEQRAKKSQRQLGTKRGPYQKCDGQITIEHADGRRLTDILYNLRAFTGLPYGKLSSLKKGKSKTANGWRIVAASESISARVAPPSETT